MMWFWSRGEIWVGVEQHIRLEREELKRVEIEIKFEPKMLFAHFYFVYDH